jgi:anti-sigma-K factor RskA
MTIDEIPDEDDLLAAEYALGLLSDDELMQAHQRAKSDVDFARQVTDWEVRLATLTDELQAETPRASVKQALLGALFPKSEPWWNRVRIWQAASVLSMIALAVLLTTFPGGNTSATGPLYTAEIEAEAGDFRVIAVVDKSTNEVILTRTAGAAPPGRILQVWAHGENAPAISVGLWPDGDSVRLALPPTIAAVEGILTLGVSEEPPGGSLTGSPSGRVFGTVDIPDVSAAS